MDKKPKVGIIIQARMSSRRLPGKSMMPIEGKPLIWHVIERLKKCKLVDIIILATSTDKNDSIMEAVTREHGVEFFQGDLDNVLDRYYQAAKKYDINIVVRITGDCPLIDPYVVDNAITIFSEGQCDYLSNGGVTWADGFDVEVFSFLSLANAWENALWTSEMEHVTQYIRKNAKNPYFMDIDKRLDPLHCSVDKIEDLEFVRAIYRILIEKGKDHLFSYKDILDILDEHPKIREINKNSVINEGYAKSLKEDKKVK